MCPYRKGPNRRRIADHHMEDSAAPIPRMKEINIAIVSI
jgi:hypothetical protein